MVPSDAQNGASGPVGDDAQARRLWPHHLVRGVILAAVALVITFSADHSAAFGLIVFGVGAILLGAADIVFLRLAADAPTRRLVLVRGIITVVAGVVALALSGTGLGTYLLTVAIWAALAGLIELYSGYRLRGRSSAAKELLVVGALTAVLAVVFVLLPPDFQQTSGGRDNAPLTLTSSVMAVGVFGAYAAIVAVYLVIAGLSLKWQTGGRAVRGAA